MARKIKDTTADEVKVLDPKETKERQKAATAQAEEKPQHFVDYLNDCLQVTVDSMADIRDMQSECWRVYNEEEPYNYYSKESWQSRIIYPKPFKLVQAGSAIIRKIFEMEFLTVEKKGEQADTQFWKELLSTLLGRNYANFPVAFADATTMALAIGQSMEIIPYWVPGQGLKFSLIEPGKIHRDPNALSRQCQSGEWWIHQEYMGWHHLMDGQRKGRYKNVEDITATGSGSGKDPNATQEEIARRKNMIWQKGKFHKDVLTYEFYGTVLDAKGDMLLPKTTFTVAADKLIAAPKVPPYPSLRWPGVGFSALPNLLRWDGRGLIQGIRSLWYLMCNLMSLHADHLNWIVNPMVEIDIYSLLDQANTDIYPGKVYRTYGTQQGHQVVRTVDFHSEVGDIMAILNFFDQRHQDGGLLDAKTMGLPGYRAEVTKGEAAQDLEQSMILVGAMGKNVEDGALEVVRASAETIRTFMTYDELVKIMGREAAEKYKDDSTPTGLNLPELGTGTFRVTGITGVMKQKEGLQNIETLLLPLMNQGQYGNMFAPYMHPYAILKTIVRMAELGDYDMTVDDDKAKAIDAAQQQQQEALIQHEAGAQAVGPEAAAAKAARDQGMAAKAEGEGEANQAQAGLFQAQAEQTAMQPPEAAPPGGVQ